MKKNLRYLPLLVFVLSVTWHERKALARTRVAEGRLHDRLNFSGALHGHLRLHNDDLGVRPGPCCAGRFMASGNTGPQPLSPNPQHDTRTPGQRPTMNT
jgi:hypothetical protein